MSTTGRQSAWRSWASESGVDADAFQREIDERAHPPRNHRRLSTADARERLGEMVNLEGLDREMAETARAAGTSTAPRAAPRTIRVTVLAEDAQVLDAAGYLVG